MTLKEITGGKVTVNNQLDMDNSERFKNVAFGYDIQSKRLIAKLDEWGKANDKDSVDRGADLMKKIQAEVNWLGKIYPAYCKHLNNRHWCRRKLKKTVSILEQVIADVDALIEG